MPRKVYIIAGTVIMLALLGNLAFKFYNKVKSLESEREWYVSRLAYNFSATVDTVKFLNGNVGPGRLFCFITDGTIRLGVEDSLMHHLKHFTELRFNESKSDDSVIFVLPGADRWKAKDKVLVNTPSDELKIFREDVLIYEDKVSNLLEGRLIKTYD